MNEQSALPSHLGRFQIVGVIGSGAMGVVYRGYDPQIRRNVALKTIHKELIAADELGAMSRFKNEAQAAGRLSHPAIVQIYDYGEEAGLSYIAMEFIEGKSLKAYLKANVKFSEPDTTAIMLQLLEALDYAHSRGVVHRDIKPANIMVVEGGHLKVADFGIARVDASELTQTGALMGTPGYMAPEQYAGQPVDGRADIYSAGVVFYELLTGVKPEFVRDDQPVPPSKVEPGVCSDGFDDVTLRALSRKPGDRFSTAGAFRAAILQASAWPVSNTISDKTLFERPRAAPDAVDGKASSSAPTGSNASSVVPAGWDASVLKRVEQQLARVVGPLARVMVKRKACVTTDLETLYDMLAQDLGSAKDKAAFLAEQLHVQAVPPSSGTTGITGRASRTQSGSQTSPLSQDVVEHGASHLARYVGPIARVIAKRVAAQTSDRREFYLRLAEAVASETDRRRFLEQAGIIP